MHKKNKPVNVQLVADTSRFAKRIGSVTYEVGIHFKKGATETMDNKIMRLIKNDMAHISAAMPTLEIQEREAV
jgi:uncharacterized protein YajQ (UPF0234 family)